MDDVVVIGGGIIGAATAYFLSKEGRKVKVIERDPTYKTASFPLSPVSYTHLTLPTIYSV